MAKLFPVEHLASALQAAFDPVDHASAFSGSDFLALGIWLLIGVRLAMRFWRKEMAR